jgi:predicted nucleic acid-binding protein
MMYCFDSSALVKCYAPEQGSAWVKSLGASGSENTLYLAQIGMVELAAALSRKVRTQEISHEEYEAALWLFLTDVRAEVYVIAPLSDPIVEFAVDVTRRYPLRGYDAVHLATAVTLNKALLGADLEPQDVQAILTGTEERLAAALNTELEHSETWPEEVTRGVELLVWMVAHGYLEVPGTRVRRIPREQAQALSHLLFDITIPNTGDECHMDVPRPLLIAALEAAYRLADELKVRKSELSTDDMLARLQREIERMNRLTKV